MDPERDGDGLSVESALAAARAVGVTKVVQVGCDADGARWAVDVAHRFADVVAAVALHPNEAPRLAARGGLDEAWRVIEELAADSRVRAVGETGLDHYRTPPEGRVSQEESFRRHIDLAKRLGKPLVIHDRDSHEDVLRVLDDEGPPDAVVFHCFSGDAAMARRCVASGWVLSFAGTVTFKNAQGLRDALAVTPLDHLLVETDAPYLAPVPFRGRPNASYLVPVTLRAMAEVKGVPVERLAEAVATTTEAVFGPW
jgi:TatD DNase family protein